MGKRNGRLFTMLLANRRLSEFDEIFYGILKDIQALNSDLISEDVLVREIYGILRSLRRGVTSHVLNIGMDERLFKAINRWRQEMTAMGSSRLDIVDVYAKLESIKAMVLSFSGSL